MYWQSIYNINVIKEEKNSDDKNYDDDDFDNENKSTKFSLCTVKLQNLHNISTIFSYLYFR